MRKKHTKVFGITLIIIFSLAGFFMFGYVEANSLEKNYTENPNLVGNLNFEVLGAATEIKVNTKVSSEAISRIKKYPPLTASKITASMIRGTGGFPTLARANTTEVFIHGFKNQKKVALTFDDGPDSQLTPKLLDILKKYDVKASFFVIGNRVDNSPGVLKRIAEEGHLVLNHSYTHPEFKKLDNNAIKKEILDNEEKIYSTIGLRPAIVRPPYGSVDQRVANLIKDLGYKTALWSIDTLDWQNRNKDKIISNVMSSVKTEDIILMHMNEDKTATLDAVPELIEKLKKSGYGFVTLDEMLEVNAYK
jgi:polysaccharide deacetylase family sporulation protein PdaB